MSRSRRPVSGLTLVAPQRPLRRSTRNSASPILMSLPTQSNSSQGLCPVDVEVGAKAQRIDLDAPLLFEAPHRGEVDQRDHVVRLVHEMPVARADQHRRAAQCRHQLPDDLLDFARAASSSRSATMKLTIVLRDRQLLRLDVQRGLDPRQRFLQHQHHEQSFLAPSRTDGVERSPGAHQGVDAVMRKRLLRLQLRRAVSGCALNPLIG